MSCCCAVLLFCCSVPFLYAPACVILFLYRTAVVVVVLCLVVAVDGLPLLPCLPCLPCLLQEREAHQQSEGKRRDADRKLAELRDTAAQQQAALLDAASAAETAKWTHDESLRSLRQQCDADVAKCVPCAHTPGCAWVVDGPLVGRSCNACVPRTGCAAN